jgi:site-specific recombinase XerC
VKHTTRKAYAQDLKAFARFCECEHAPFALAKLFSMSAKKAFDYAEGYKKTLAGKPVLTFRRRVSTLRAACTFAKKQEMIGWELPISLRVERTEKQAAKAVKKDMSGPPEAVVQRLRKKLTQAGTARALRDLAIVDLFHYRGLRVGEAVGIDVEGVSFRKRTVTVLAKGADLPEELEVKTVVLESLRRWIDVRPGPRKGPLFVGLDHRGKGEVRLSANSVLQMLKARGRWIGYSDSVIRPHGLRHTSITAAVEHGLKAGLKLKDVQAFARHKNLNTTVGYLNEESLKVREVMDAIP